MLQRVKEVQESDLRMDGALARNIQRVIAVTQADIDAAAAQGKGWLVKRVVKVNDPLDNLRGGTQLVIKQNSILPGQNVMRVLYSGNSKTVGPAVAPLSLSGAAAEDILSLIAFGGTEQNGTPTPDAPVDIVCNNGALRFTANEANYTADNVTLGYWLRNNNGQPEPSSTNFYTAMMPVKPNTSYVCFGRTKNTNVISAYNRIAWYDADGVWIRNSTYTANTPGIDTSPANAAFARFHCNPNGAEVTQELVDSYNWVFQVGTAEVPYTPYSPTKVYTAGPIETIAIKDDQNATVSTATCEDLLSVGAYTDEQEIISGVVTKKVGVMVLDGTENWQLATATDLVQFYTSITQGVIANNVSLTSTIAPYGCTVANRTQYDFGCYSGNSGNLCFQMKGSATLTTVSAWTQYLADQYAAGTPVIVIYPLATQTTDTVTPQPMQTAAGDNTAEITQAGMAGLELEVEYVEA